MTVALELLTGIASVQAVAGKEEKHEMNIQKLLVCSEMWREGKGSPLTAPVRRKRKRSLIERPPRRAPPRAIDFAIHPGVDGWRERNQRGYEGERERTAVVVVWCRKGESLNAARGLEREASQGAQRSFMRKLRSAIDGCGKTPSLFYSLTRTHPPVSRQYNIRLWKTKPLWCISPATCRVQRHVSPHSHWATRRLGMTRVERIWRGKWSYSWGN